MTTAPARPSISSAIVGAEVGPFSHSIDARWIMAHAAGLGETDPCYRDTLAPGGPVAHPLFAVCYEWPVALAMRAKTIDDAIATLSVHASHRAVVHRSPRAGDTLSTSARVIAVRRRRAGTLIVTRFVTVDAAGQPVTTTDYGSLYRGVGGDGEAQLDDADVSRATAAEGFDGARSAWGATVEVGAEAAHVYTECARIWNPIHTDVAVARAAGLPGLILHGTATLALAVSRVVTRELGGDPARVREVQARFTGYVTLPSAFTVRAIRGGDDIAFDAVNDHGTSVLGGGHVFA